jgi:hypothetical protein
MKRLTALFLALTLITASSCKKNKDIEPDPQPDPQKLDPLVQMENKLRFQSYFSLLPEVSTTDYIITGQTYSWNSIASSEKKAFTWQADIFGNSNSVSDWETPYSLIGTADATLNQYLDSVPVTDSNAVQWKQVKGHALFLRSLALYEAAQLFAKPYDSTTAETDLGVPLRAVAVEQMKRPSLKETYSSIVDSLKAAISLLPETIYDRQFGSKPAANALLARVYLSMHQYDSAELYALHVLEVRNLLDYRGINTSDDYLIKSVAPTNQEILFYSTYRSGILYDLRNDDDYAYIDTTLFRSYLANDLRRDFLYDYYGWYLKTGGYSTNYSEFFNGLATDEIYLIVAECEARKGNTADALKYLNALLEKRYVNGKFTNLTAGNSQEALTLVLNERKKELAFRGLRWYDLRRLNKEGANIALTRAFNNTTYTLPPNSPLYVFPIPNYIISKSGMTQNPR